MADFRVLVVDNEAEQAHLMRYLLSSLGYEVDTAASAESALEKMAAADYRAILTDLIMPDMDGLELCRSIKARRPDIAVYGVSGFTGLYDDQQLAQAGFDGLLQKPVHAAQLQQLLKSGIRIQT